MDCKKLKQIYYDSCNNLNKTDNMHFSFIKNGYYQIRDECKENKELYVLCCLENQDNTKNKK